MDNEERLRAFREIIKRQRQPLPRVEKQEELVVHSENITWYKPEGTNPSTMGPVLGLPIKSFELFLQEIEPGGSSDMQQHHHEAVHYVLSGDGYSELNSERFEWSTGDFISVPPMYWHRHYNLSQSEPVRMLLIENSKLLEALDLNYRASAGFLTYTELSEKLGLTSSTTEGD